MSAKAKIVKSFLRGCTKLNKIRVVCASTQVKYRSENAPRRLYAQTQAMSSLFCGYVQNNLQVRESLLDPSPPW